MSTYNSLPDWAEGLDPVEAADMHKEQQITLASLQAASPNSDELPFPNTIIGRIALEVREHIFGQLFGTNNMVDITIPHAKRGAPRLEFQRLYHQVPWFKEAFQTILLSCKDLHREVLEYLSRETIFINRLSDSAKHLPRVFGSGCGMIRKLAIGMDFRTKVRHEEQYYMLLKMLNDDMPELTQFKLYSDYPTHNTAYPPEESGDPYGTCRHNQELRAIVRFGAFVTLRHPNLKVMVLPAKSGPTYEIGDNYTTCLITLFPSNVARSHRPHLKLAHGMAIRKTQHKDLVLDSALIRKLKWTELAWRDPVTLALNVQTKTAKPVDDSTQTPQVLKAINRPVYEITDPATIMSSECNAADEADPYKVVDERGYMPFFVLRQKKFWVDEQYDTVDKLIDDVRALENDVAEVFSGESTHSLGDFIHTEGQDFMVDVSLGEEARRLDAARYIEDNWQDKWARRNAKPYNRGFRGGGDRVGYGRGRGGSWGGRRENEQHSQDSGQAASGFGGGPRGRRSYRGGRGRGRGRGTWH